MNRIAKDILRVASDLVPRIRATFKKEADMSERDLNTIHFDIQRFIGTLRRNEEMSCFVTRQDDDKTMEIVVGFTDHEAMNGIVDSLNQMFKKIERTKGIEVNIDVLQKTKEKT